MNVLVIGDANSIYVKSIIEKTMLPYHDCVKILTYQNNYFSDDYVRDTIEVDLIAGPDNIIGKLFGGVFNRSVLSNNYDIVNVHFASLAYLVMLPFVRRNTKRVIVSYWGSDLLRHSQFVGVDKWLLRFADIITLENEEMITQFKKRFGEKYNGKIRQGRFGSVAIDKMNKTIVSEDIKKKYRIPSNKIIVSIGYNASPKQQHDRVLESILELPLETRQQMHLFLRLSYGGGNEDYYAKLKTLISKTKCTCSLFMDYLSPDEVAELTQITDIFIHAQITDSRSASVMEHLYARCLVLNPSWIQYPEFKEMYYLEYSSFDELKSILENNLTTKENSIHADLLRKNAEAVFQMASWDSFVPEWRNIYTAN